MYSFAGFLVTMGGVLGLVVGAVHIGFALTETAPRSVWSWYVVAMGIGMFAMTFPAALYIGEQMAKHP